MQDAWAKYLANSWGPVCPPSGALPDAPGSAPSLPAALRADVLMLKPCREQGAAWAALPELALPLGLHVHHAGGTAESGPAKAETPQEKRGIEY